MSPAPISMDLRRRIVVAVESGSSIRQAAARYSVSISAAIKLMRRVRATGSPLKPAQIGGYRRPLLGAARGAPARSGGTPKSDITLGGDPGRVVPAGGCIAGPVPPFNQPSPPARPVAQKKSLRAAEQDRPDVAQERRRWRVWQRCWTRAASCSWTRRGPPPT